jgi:hypothetical protein
MLWLTRSRTGKGITPHVFVFVFRLVVQRLIIAPACSWMGNLVTNRTWEHFW